MFALVKPQLPLPAQLIVPDPESTVHKLAPRHCRGRVPVGETFFSERFGMLTDRFGTPWMINGPSKM